MIKLLVVDEQEDRRAAVVDALCELPGVEVRATAASAAAALAILDHMPVDAVIAASGLAGASIVTLIDGARRRAQSNIIVAITQRPLLPGMVDYWRDLGARAVVENMADLVDHVCELAAESGHHQERRRELAQNLETAVVVERRAEVLSYASASGASGMVAQPLAFASMPQQIVSVGAALRDALPRLSRVVHDEIELILEVVSGLPPVRCRVDDVERIALHMILDAARAIPLGGKIWLFVEREDHRHVRIEVLDSSGMSRTPSLGLDMIRAIASRYGGEVRFVELAGGAISLQVTLPAIVEAAS
ncbi:MAG TPA: ATP-binding protein [Kofleriaceae bacterium]